MKRHARLVHDNVPHRDKNSHKETNQIVVKSKITIQAANTKQLRWLPEKVYLWFEV